MPERCITGRPRRGTVVSSKLQAELEERLHQAQTLITQAQEAADQGNPGQVKRLIKPVRIHALHAIEGARSRSNDDHGVPPLDSNLPHIAARDWSRRNRLPEAGLVSCPGDAELRTASPAEADRSPRVRGACLLGELQTLSRRVSIVDS